MKPLLLFLSTFLLFNFSTFCQDNSTIIKLNYSFLNFDVIDNSNSLSFTFKTVLNNRAKEHLVKLEAQYPGIGEYKLTKIFPFLTTKDTVSISRLGEKITIPPFWSTFVLTSPDNVDNYRLMFFLNEFNPLVEYAHPNYKIELTSPPNDTHYLQQESLNGSSVLLNAGINIEEAWAIETGEPFIKIGVHDTGIDTTHEDIDVLFGGAYYQSDTIFPHWGSDEEGHGTSVAGIIAAKSNNGIGISGIAGGDGTDSTGCSLIDFKFPFLSQSSVNYIMAGIVDGARAVGTYWDYPQGYYDNQWNQATDNASYFENSPGFGIHIGNHSYLITTVLPAQIIEGLKVPGDNDNTELMVPECVLCREAYLFSLKNGVINVVARGNSQLALPSTDPTYITDWYPQSFPDNWIILVGASGYDGNTIQPGLNQSPTEVYQNFASLYGNGMDLIAPGSDSIVYTTLTTTNIPNSDPYKRFNGTSAAAPHVTGVIGLLLSHYNKGCYNKRNLSIEDVEYILEKSATNLYGPGYDDTTGWGRLDAGKALKMIENATKQIIHPELLLQSEIISTDTMVMHYKQAFVADGWGPISSPFPLEQNNYYQVERILYQNKYSFDQYILPSTNIVDYWARPSASNSLRFFQDTISYFGGSSGTQYNYDHFDATPFDTIVSIDTILNEINVQGYYYHFINKYINANIPISFDIDSLSNIDIWYPINPTIDTAKMFFSMYIIDDSLISIYDFPCDSENLPYDVYLNTLEIEKNSECFKVYPNPTNSMVYLESIDGTLLTDISICDINGKVIYSHKPNTFNDKIDVSKFVEGIYFIKCSNIKTSETFKIIKL